MFRFLLLAMVGACVPDPADIEATRGARVDVYFNDPGARPEQIWYSDAVRVMVDLIDNAQDRDRLRGHGVLPPRRGPCVRTRVGCAASEIKHGGRRRPPLQRRVPACSCRRAHPHGHRQPAAHHAPQVHGRGPAASWPRRPPTGPPRTSSTTATTSWSSTARPWRRTSSPSTSRCGKAVFGHNKVAHRRTVAVYQVDDTDCRGLVQPQRRCDGSDPESWWTMRQKSG